jgi:hypothetical protein
VWCPRIPKVAMLCRTMANSDKLLTKVVLDDNLWLMQGVGS